MRRSNYPMVLWMGAGSMSLGKWVYVNGEFVRSEDAAISPFDRGFLFAQAAYEVTAVCRGKLIDFDAHLARLARTLEGIEVLAPDEDLAALHQDLIQRNDLQEGLVYLQVTGGDQGSRDFYGPEDLKPGVFMFATHKTLIGDLARDGITAITVPDTRWKRRDMKTTQLLSQSLAYRAARRAGAFTAIMHEEGLVTEAASANLWIATEEGVLVTRDLGHALLPGITRASLAHLLREQGLEVEERAFSVAEMFEAREVFTSSTGLVIAPVLKVDETPIGTGAPGAVTRMVQEVYYRYIGAEISAFAWL